ncbi:MAG: tetratricopeptide repeat protein [Xenococcaceae cyanobacterium]
MLNLSIAFVALLLGTTVDRGLGTSVVFAQSYKPNPLESNTPDPLLPSRKRPLSPLERFRIKQVVDELNTEANAQLKAGNDDKAFEIWYRELRLQRALGRLEEVQALERVGAIAWDKNRQADVQFITERLEVIQQEAETEAEIEPVLLSAFGRAYEQLRIIDKALEIYQQILSNAREQEDISALEATLKTIGQLHLIRFDYLKAAATYEELLTLARSHSDSFHEGIYLQRLAEIYSEVVQPENALRIKQQLAHRYVKNQQIQKLAALKISIASDYEALDQPEEASLNYQEAFALAWSLQHFAMASEALQKLGDLYRAYDQNDYALQIYLELLKVEQRSYNYYGLMNTYDRMGQIYLEQKNYPQALAAFRQALEIATSLSYQETYFTTQIEQVNQEIVEQN